MKKTLDKTGAPQVKVSADRRADAAEDQGCVIFEGTQHTVLVRADRRVPLQELLRQIGTPEAARFRHGGACKRQHGVPRGARDGHGVALPCGEGQKTFDVSFRLARRGVEVQAHHMKDAKERPDLRRGDVPSLEVSDDLAQFVAIVSCLVGDESFPRQPGIELGAVPCGAGAVQKTREVLEKRVGAPKCDQNEAVIGRREAVRALEVLPEILDGLRALVVRCADREAALDLSGELLRASAGPLTHDKEIIRLPPKTLRLKMRFRHNGVDQDRRNATHKRCASQYAATCCSKKVPAPPVEAGLEVRCPLKA